MKKTISIATLLFVSACSMFEPNKRLNPLDSKNPLAASGGTFSIAPGSSKTEIILNWSGVTASNLEGWYVYGSTGANMPSSYLTSVDKSAVSATLTGITPYTTNWNFWLQPYSNSYTGSAVKSRFDLGGVVYDTSSGFSGGGPSCFRFENIPKGFSRAISFSAPNAAAVYQAVNEFRYYYKGSGLGPTYGAMTLTLRIANSNITMALKTNLPAGDVTSYNYATISNSVTWVPFGMSDILSPVMIVSNASDDDGTNLFFLDVLSIQSNTAAGAVAMTNQLEGLTGLSGDLRP